ncbi:PAS domain-containing protein [Streptomyces echinatus]|uniref:PAS domain-containing protein n=1 Tax=Streptomyces echinatus TaxID=67293 RepID=UPI00379E3A27
MDLAPWDASEVEAATVPTVAADDGNRIIAVNDPTASLLGWPAHDLVGQRQTVGHPRTPVQAPRGGLQLAAAHRRVPHPGPSDTGARAAHFCDLRRRHHRRHRPARPAPTPPDRAARPDRAGVRDNGING